MLFLRWGEDTDADSLDDDEPMEDAVAYRAIPELLAQPRAWVKKFESLGGQYVQRVQKRAACDELLKIESESDDSAATVDALISTSRPLTPEGELPCRCKSGCHEALVRCDSCTEYGDDGVVLLQRWQCTECNDFQTIRDSFSRVVRHQCL